jgi:endonuclease/exonuclease/phosphatase family metal-dependent hydrolase
MNTANRPHFTFPAETPERQIDYVMVYPEARWTIREVRVLEAPVASDHRPLLVVLELQPE